MVFSMSLKSVSNMTFLADWELACGGTIMTGAISLLTILRVLLPIKIWPRRVEPVIPIMINCILFSRTYLVNVSRNRLLSSATQEIRELVMAANSVFTLSSASSMILNRLSSSSPAVLRGLLSEPYSRVSKTLYKMRCASGTRVDICAAYLAAFLDASEKSMGTIKLFICRLFVLHGSSKRGKYIKFSLFAL